MDRPPELLEQRLRRLRESLERGRTSHGELAGKLLGVAAHHALDVVSARLERRLARERAREERRRLRQLRSEQAALPRAVVLGTVAVALLYGGAVLPHARVLVLVGLGLGFAALAQLGRVRWGSAATAPQATSAPEPPELRAITEREQRVDAVSAQVLAELKSAPAPVQDFVRAPSEVVKGLQAACHELARRERELRQHLGPAEGARLESERAGLDRRVAQEADAQARGQLAAALAALDSQLAHRKEMALRATRLEAEGVRVVYALENLRAQVLRARAAGSASGAEGRALLDAGLAQVSEELSTIAEALESTR